MKKKKLENTPEGKKTQRKKDNEKKPNDKK